MTLSSVVKNILVEVGLSKKHTTLNGRKITKFPYDLDAFMISYAAIVNKKSKLPAKRRAFVLVTVRKWLLLNKINIEQFDSQLLEHGTTEAKG